MGHAAENIKADTFSSLFLRSARSSVNCHTSSQASLTSMPSLTQFLAAAALVATSAAAPTKQGFTVEQVVTNPGKLTHGAHLTLKTYRKFGAEPPSHVVEAAAAQTGSVAATPEQYDSEYLCPVTIGSGVVNLDFDTGSSDL